MTPTFRSRLVEAMAARGLRAVDLCERTGITKGAMSAYVHGKAEARQTALHLLAVALDVSEAWLMGLDAPMERDGVNVSDDVVEFPVIGEVAAGYDYIAQENWEGDTIEIPRSYLHGRPASDYMVLSVVGDSMYPEYRDGDRVLIKKCETMPCSGRVGLFRYNGENATLKRIDYINGEDWVKLVPINPMYPPVKITGEDLTRCAVIGVPVCLIREIEE